MAEERKEYRIGSQILHEDDLKFKVEYKGETFTLRYPTPLMVNQIEIEVARRLGGMDQRSFSPEILDQIKMISYVNSLLVIEECPKWFQENVKSLWEFYDEALVFELYRGYANFRDTFRDRVSKGGFEPGRAGAVG